MWDSHCIVLGSRGGMGTNEKGVGGRERGGAYEIERAVSYERGYPHPLVVICTAGPPCWRLPYPRPVHGNSPCLCRVGSTTLLFFGEGVNAVLLGNGIKSGFEVAVEVEVVVVAVVIMKTQLEV